MYQSPQPVYSTQAGWEFEKNMDLNGKFKSGLS